jgi:hypothetical protein
MLKLPFMTIPRALSTSNTLAALNSAALQVNARFKRDVNSDASATLGL